MTATILTIIGGLLGGGLITGILLHKRESPKAKADAAKTIADSALEIVKEVKEDNAVFKRDLALAIDYAQSLRDHIYQGNPPPPPAWPGELKNR